MLETKKAQKFKSKLSGKIGCFLNSQPHLQISMEIRNLKNYKLKVTNKLAS